MLNAKENYLACLRGEQPEYVPRYSFGRMPGQEGPVSNQMVGPPQLMPGFNPDGGERKDIFGVRYISTDSAGGGGMPANDYFLLPLEGIVNWGDYVTIPDYSDVDWHAALDNWEETSGINRAETAVTLNLCFGYFQMLMAFMGFENGMIALYEYPDEVKDLLQALSDFYMNICDNVIDIYKPDIMGLCDDIAAWHAPFCSPDMFREFFMPHHDRLAGAARDRGLLMDMHCCGKTEDNIPLYREMGIMGWSAAQTCNDLAGIKATYGNSFVIMGGWDATPRLLEPFASPENPDGLTEEELRQSVRDAFDMLAPGGGYVWAAGFLTAIGDELGREKNMIIQDEAVSYGDKFYK